MRRLVWSFILVALVGQAIGGCGRGARTSQDSWYTGLPSEGPTYWTWPELDRTRIHQVIEAHQSQAEELLRDVSIAELTDAQAGRFIGEELPEAPGTRPYLTRGVCLNRETGGFAVHVREGKVVVYHGSLARGAAPMTRQALVLQLEREPTEVFVACSAAE